MLKRIVKRALQATGRWSFTVAHYYPVHPRPRWGHGRASHPQIRAALETNRKEYESVLANIERHRDILHNIGHENVANNTAPFWNNWWFSVLDAAALVTFLIERPARRYLEIGSGHSTRFARYAVNAGGLPTSITSIDPHPRDEIDPICDNVIRQALEDCELSIFDELENGDILFFDGSHRIFTNSDVSVFFFEVLPRVKPGVLVHIHDIFLPDDYPPAWNDRLYSEQYLVAAMLLCRSPPFKVVLPNYFVCTDPLLGARVRRIFAARDGGLDIPFFYSNDAASPGVSFWIETVSTQAA
jgi:hypothetical protein